jgi:DNA mismatch endonuclease (patch repair protein)
MSSKSHYVATSLNASERMRKIKSKGTGLEKAMERILRGASIKFKRQPKLLGHPDFQIRDTNVLIFCDSSFWHGRRKNELDGSAFSANKHLWVEKLNATKKRDVCVSRALRRQGWSVQRFWDTDILHNPSKVRARLKRILSHYEAENKNAQTKCD